MEDNKIKNEVDEVIKELDKEIENLSNEASEFAQEKFDEMSKEAKNAANIISQAKDKLVEYVSKVTDQEKVKQVVDYVKKGSNDLYNGTLNKVNEFKESDVYKNAVKTCTDIKDRMSKDEDINKFVDDVKTYSKEAVDAVKNNETVTKVTDKYNEVKKNVTDYLAKPEVSEKINSAKNATTQITEKAKDVLKNFISGKEDK